MSVTLTIFLFYIKIATAQIPAIDPTHFFNNSEFQQTTSKLPLNQCQKQLLKVQNGLMNKEMWALKMIDSFAKPQSGVLMGNIMHVGNIDECLEIEQIQGKYCMISYELKGNLLRNFPKLTVLSTKNITEGHFTRLTRAATQSYGICVPNDCAAKDLQSALDHITTENNLPVNLKFLDESCFRGGKPFSTITIIAIFFALLRVSATIYDVFVYQKLPKFAQKPNVLVAFSMYSNTRIIFDTSKSSPETIKCLDGIRVLSMMWIILGHQFLITSLLVQNLAKKINWMKKPENSFILASTVSVDTFFTISGLLVVYISNKQLSKGVKFPFFKFYIHRILRLAPSLIMTVLFTVTLLKYTASGPMWFVLEERFQKPCEANWWATLTYVQNYVNPDKQCVPVAWYLAADTQMYFLSPLIFFPLFKWPKKTIAIIGVFVVLNSAFLFQITYRNQFGSIPLTVTQEAMKSIYWPTHVRASGYLIGMVLGYFLYKSKTDTPIKLSKNKVTLLWVTSVLVMIGIIYAHHEMAFEYNVLASSFFNALARIGWSLSVSVIIFLCANGHGGIVNTFLSSSFFTVLYRVNYAAYLLHVNVLVALVGHTRTPIYFSNFVQLQYFWGNFAFTLSAAFFWCLAFEIPVVKLERIFFASREKSDQNIEMRVEDVTQVVTNGNQKVS